MNVSSSTSRESASMEQALQSPTVQRALPDLAGLHSTLGFDSFLAHPPPTITSDPRAVRAHIRGYAVQLERHERFTNLWKHQYANQLVNLRQLITTVDTRCKELEQSVNLAHATTYDLDKMLLGLREFEDLYYFLACKTRTLYSDLQLRFVSNFIAMDDVLHHRGSSSYAHNDCTVRDLRNFLRAVWFHLLHPVIVRTIETSINHRKYQVLKANPLIPLWNVERDKMENYKLGLNLDASTMCSMFEHLDDVSAMSVPALLLKVSQRGLGICYTPSEIHLSSQNSNDGSSRAIDNTRISIQNEDEDYIQQQTQKDELKHNICACRQHHKGSKSDDPWPKSANAIRYPAQRSSILARQPPVHVIHSGGDGMLQGTSALDNVTKWLPSIVVEDIPTPSSPGYKTDGAQRLMPPTTSRARTTANSLPSTPSNYRIPFHGNEKFPHDPPTPPPKSPPQVTRTKGQDFQAKMERLHKDNSRLQDALRQVQVLQRENSQLQEHLSQVSPAKGLFRRLSKARSRSPPKSSRRSIINGVVG